MKNKEIVANVIIGVLVVAIIAVVAVKFIFKKEHKLSFDIRGIEEVGVLDLEKNPVRFVDLIPKDDVIYCMLFDMRDCTSCIIKGLDDLKELRKEGKRTITLAIFDLMDDLRDWANVNECEDIYMLKKVTFYDYFFCQTTPVLIRFNNGDIEAFKYIIP